MDEELGVTPGNNSDDPQDDRWRPTGSRTAVGTAARRVTRQKATAAPTATTAHAANGRGGLPCTEKQVRALHAFSRRAGVELTAELRRLGVTTAEELSRRQASDAIDRFKERAET